MAIPGSAGLSPASRFLNCWRSLRARPSLVEGLAATVLVAEAAWLLSRHGWPPLLVQVLLWGQIALTLAGFRSQGFFQLFGPVLIYDLIRTARRNRYFLIRCLYAAFLGLTLFYIYLTWQFRTGGANSVRANDMANFTSSFFFAYMIVQFTLVIVLTPAYTAGAIAEEKERKTLEFILATDLRNREIVLSKLVSRLLNITMLVLTGLPLLSIMQLLGGVDPTLLLAGFAATGLTILGLGVLSILNSVITRRARDAIVLTYVEALAYIVLAAASWLLLLPQGWANFPSTLVWTSPITLRDLVEILNSGNLPAILLRVFADWQRGGRLDLILPGMLRDYASFHGLLILICGAAAVLRLRAVALKEKEGRPKRLRSFLPMWPRPPVSDRPMVWKEIYAERGPRLHWVGRIVLGLLVIGSLTPVAFIFNYVEIIYDFSHLAEAMNIWARITGAMVGSLLLLNVAVRAAGSISGERDKMSFDALLTSPLDSEGILYGKWLGSVLSVRWGWIWMGLIWGPAMVTGGLSIFAFPLLVSAWLIYASFVACLGLWFSMNCRTSLRATLWTLTSAVFLGVGHWLIWLFCIPLFRAGGVGPDFETFAKFQVGITPPLALGYCFCFESSDFLDRREMLLGHGIAGLVFWGIAAVIFSGVLRTRFRRLTDRVNEGRTRSFDLADFHRPALRARSRRDATVEDLPE
ncbi:MAG: ABC transporter permease [Gemmataceae bacterium]